MIIIDRASSIAARSLIEDAHTHKSAKDDKTVDYEEWIRDFILVRVFDRLTELGLLKQYLALPRAHADGYLMEVIPDYLDFIRDTVTEALKQLNGTRH